jgi:DNA modification methylase
MQAIHNYAIIGDCRSAALVSRDGSIDWLCWPRFDSPSIFGALLDSRAGQWRIAPVAPFKTERRYVDETDVLETRFATETGSLLLIDLMPVASEGEKENLASPTHKPERSLAAHPSLKPQAFLRILVRGVLPLGEGVVLDPFAGSGSTLAAADAAGYESIGVEKDSRYFELAC